MLKIFTILNKNVMVASKSCCMDKKKRTLEESTLQDVQGQLKWFVLLNPSGQLQQNSL
jgi:hypothetical protein